jgi:hypothetical protein
MWKLEVGVLNKMLGVLDLPGSFVGVLDLAEMLGVLDLSPWIFILDL